MKMAICCVIPMEELPASEMANATIFSPKEAMS
jgi:hypothetical protein